MAEGYSDWRSYGSGGSMRAVVRLSDPPEVTKDTASVTLTAWGLIQTTRDMSDSTNTNTLSGSISASDPNKTVNHGSGGGLTEVVMGSGVFATQYGVPVTVSVTATLSGYEIVSGSTAASVSVTIPARPWQPPAAPTAPTITRNSDTSHTVTWVRNSTSSGPYSGQTVQRWDNVSGVWSSIAGVSDTATSYTDTSTVADRLYRYRIVAWNSSGQGTSGPSGDLLTSPAAPTSASAVKNAAGSIVVSWSGLPSYGSGYVTEIAESQNGGAWVALAEVAAGSTSYTHVSPSTSVTHRYAVRHRTTAAGLVSGWAYTDTVQLLAPPSAPTSLRPTTIRDATETVALQWQHNPVDGSPQTAFQLRHRPAGTSTWTTVSVTSSSSSWVLTGNTYPNPVAVEWQVCTKGLHASYSPWSATATSPTSARPTALINTPADGATVTTSHLTVAWGYFDAEGAAQAAWEVTLLSGGVVVETRTGSGAATSTDLATVLPDGSAWQVRVRVQDGAGMWSLVNTANITVAYAPPPLPVVTPAWDAATGTVTLAITVPAPGPGQVAAVSVDVWRSVDGGAWTLIAQGVPPGSAVTDYAPTVAGTNSYRVVAQSAAPSTAEVVESITTPTAGDVSALWLSGGPGFSQVCRGVSNVSVRATAGVAAKVLRRYAGRVRPMERAGVGTARAWSVSLDHIPAGGHDDTPPAGWLALGQLAGPHLLRLPDLYVTGTLSDVETDRAVGGYVTRIAFTFTESGD